MRGWSIPLAIALVLFIFLVPIVPPPACPFNADCAAPPRLRSLAFTAFAVGSVVDEFGRYEILGLPKPIILGTTTSQTYSSGTSTVCTVNVPLPQGIHLRVVSDGTGAPVAGLRVTTQYELSATCDRNDLTLIGSSLVTNSSGWIVFNGGYPWYFVLNYSGRNYNFTINSSPMAWSIATIRVPSGVLTTQICGLGGGSPAACQGSSTTTV